MKSRYRDVVAPQEREREMLSYVEITSVLLGTVGADEHTQTLAVVVPIWRFDCLFYAPPPPTPPPPKKKLKDFKIYVWQVFIFKIY